MRRVLRQVPVRQADMTLVARQDTSHEFQMQDLELDWTCVNSDAGLRFGGAGWNYHDFRGSNWENVNNTEPRTYSAMRIAL